MVAETGTALCDGKKSKLKKNILQKTLKIVNKSYRNEYTIGLNIQGEHLKRFGFELGDKVSVLISQNQIRISKIIEND